MARTSATVVGASRRNAPENSSFIFESREAASNRMLQWCARQATKHPVTDRPPLSVVVPTRDRPQLLGGCLAALRASLGPQDELIVADSASHGDATGRVAADHGA